jgi:hypothetical protein
VNEAQKHALLSPSAAHRWIHCPPSARLCEHVEDSGSSYAAEGTCAHELCENKLRTFLGEKPADPRGTLEYYDAKMEDATDDYVNFCVGEYERLKASGGKPLMIVEQRVRYEQYVPHGNGSADCLIIGDGEMVVVDFKYGAGVAVDADDNPQLKLYALGCLLAFDGIYYLSTVKMCIVQPRRDNLSTVTASKESLYQWADEVVKPAAELAWRGDGEQCAGDWCRFCKIKANCRARATANMALAVYEFRNPLLLENDEIAAILGKLDALTDWSSDVKEFALTEALKGVKYDGWKIVEGRSNRRFTDENAVADKVQTIGLDPYKHELLGITAMTDLLGKKRFEETLGMLVVKPSGKPVLVPNSDKRQPINIISGRTISPTTKIIRRNFYYENQRKSRYPDQGSDRQVPSQLR